MLNVGHGDSIVVEYVHDDVRSFGVIDSNRHAGQIPAIRKLREIGAEQLSFVALTHPHSDHYRGLLEIIEQFPTRQIFAFPMVEDLRRLKKLFQQYREMAARTDSEALRRDAFEFVKFFILAHERWNNGELDISELTGPGNRINPEGFAGVEVTVLLPLKKYKGDIYHALEHGTFEPETTKTNELSLSLSFVYGGRTVLFGADGTERAWFDHRKELAKSNTKLAADIVKLPHHGSRIDCSEQTIDYVYVNAGEHRLALVSADGRSHPAPETLAALHARGIKPYCTNLAKVCGANIDSMFTAKDASPEAVRWINMHRPDVADAVRRPCQGDVCVSIQSSGEIVVTRQFENACAYRGDYDLLTG
jgi:beta-lactamase superfamily II metal-dependent hydrolase